MILFFYEVKRHGPRFDRSTPRDVQAVQLVLQRKRIVANTMVRVDKDLEERYRQNSPEAVLEKKAMDVVNDLPRTKVK